VRELAGGGQNRFWIIVGQIKGWLHGSRGREPVDAGHFRTPEERKLPARCGPPFAWLMPPRWGDYNHPSQLASARGRRLLPTTHNMTTASPPTPADPATSLTSALAVKALRKSYGTVEVLHGVDLSVGPGERVALMGPSGSGKSTLLNCICGIESVDGGEITVAGADLTKMTPPELERTRRESIGYVFQSFHLLPTLTAFENVEFPGQLIGMAAKERRERARALLEQVGMSQRAGHLPDALSGGERQRVALARAVMNSPPLILADEPTGSLDSVIGDNVLELLRAVSDELNIALLLVTHDADCARICHRTVRLRDGRIVDSD